MKDIYYIMRVNQDDYSWDMQEASFNSVKSVFKELDFTSKKEVLAISFLSQIQPAFFCKQLSTLHKVHLLCFPDTQVEFEKITR